MNRIEKPRPQPQYQATAGSASSLLSNSFAAADASTREATNGQWRNENRIPVSHERRRGCS